MCEYIQNCCRTCLDMRSNHVSILGDLTISLHLRTCLAITVSPTDNLPKTICVHCVAQLSQFYNFLLHARCSQDWLESTAQMKVKKNVETKIPIQPLPDSEYNSDSLLEFLNNTANIDDYLNNLGKEDIPSIVNMLDRNEHSLESTKNDNRTKKASPKKKELKASENMAMEIDVLDSDVEIVKEIIMKEVDPKINIGGKVKSNFHTCYGCKLKFDGILKLSQHVSTCDNASRRCVQCDTLFDSRQKMIEHSVSHTSLPTTCACGEHFNSRDKLASHQKTCRADYTNLGCIFRCKECGDVFKDRLLLFRHAREHILKSEERTCDICGHIFIGNEALVKHKKKDHNQSENVMYRCKVCNLKLPDRKEMYLHVKSHTAKPELSRHLCESCGKSFATRAILIRHSTLHNKNYDCNICCKHFTNAKEKEKHMVEHSDVTMCEFCGKTVSTHELNGHTCI